MRSSLIWLVITSLLVACGDDGLDKKFVPDEQDDEEEGLSPIEPGFKTRYLLKGSYLPDAVQNSNGALPGEVQRGGSVCITVDEVQDTAKEEYASADETLIVGRLRARGTVSSANLDTRLEGELVDGDQVDSALTSLWLSDLTLPSADHGYGEAQDLTFTTRTAPAPGKSLANLFFFEARSFEDKSWLGWDGQNTDADGVTKNFLNELYRYFIDNGVNIAGTDFNHSSYVNPACATGENNGVACYSLTLVWRETTDASWPSEYGDTAIHRLRVEYDIAGILKNMTEYIVSDITPDSDVPGDVTACIANEPCMSALLDNFGDFSGTACAF